MKKLTPLTILTILALGTSLAINWGIDIKAGFQRLIGLKDFANDAKLQIKRIYGFAINGGVTGTLKLLLDVDVANNASSDVTASNLLVNLYNEQNVLIGSSEPYTQVTLHANSTTTITGIEANIQLSKLLPDYAIPALLQVIASGTLQNFKFDQTIKIDVFVTLNGVKVNQQIYHEI